MTLHPNDHRKLWLEKLVKENNFTRGIEIGVQGGVTFTHLLESCPDLHMTGIDLWYYPKHQAQYDKMKREVYRLHGQNDRATLINENTKSAHIHIQYESVDFIFIDADHTYEGVKRDIGNYASKVKVGGYICGHDITDPQVNRAVVEYFGDTYSTGPDMVWYVKKVK